MRRAGLEHLFGAAGDHVEQACHPGPGPDRGEVDDHGDIAVAVAGVAPHVLVHPDRGDAVVAGRVLDQHVSAFGDPGDAQMLDHQRDQGPPHRGPGQLRAWLGGSGGVLAPHVPRSRCSDNDARAPATWWVTTRTVRTPADVPRCPVERPDSHTGGTSHRPPGAPGAGKSRAITTTQQALGLTRPAGSGSMTRLKDMRLADSPSQFRGFAEGFS